MVAGRASFELKFFFWPLVLIMSACLFKQSNLAVP